MELIKEIYRKKADERERLRKRVLEEVFRAIDKLSRGVRFEEAYIFGSVTRPYQFGESSDIDIAFKGLDRDKLFSTIGFLSNELKRDVNVVPIEDLHFKDKLLREGIRWKRG